MILNENGSDGKGNVSGTFVKETTLVSELTVTPSTVPLATVNVMSSLLASVTASVCNEGYDWPASSARVVSVSVNIGGKLAVKEIP